MNRENFFRKFDKIVGQFGDAKPGILLHSCCGPCSSSVLELLSKYFDVTVLWYNPNLYPEAEYDKRLETQKQLIDAIAEDGVQARLLVEPWRSEDYFSRIKGLENEPEEGKRCLECFKIRLEETARIASERGFEWFCTTLTVSSRKDAVAINAIGREAEAKYGVKWLPSEFKKREGNHRSIILSEKYGLYRQEYCGCVFSLVNREKNDEN
ncbi:MAG: epoxyqueuosine reductase QueH [Firmicutes bacterium]|nr:epoxyqueuosine reductase QueH [Bacillota bacterium]